MKNIVLIFLLISTLSFSLTAYSQPVAEEWVTRYNNFGHWDIAHFLAIDDSGNVYVTGYSSGIGSSLDYATIKYNSSGVQQWVARYNGPGNYVDNSRFLAVDGLGNVYVTGYSYGNGTDYDYATIKYNSSGVQQWIARYNGTGNGEDWASSLAVDNFGNVYVTGRSFDSVTSHDYTTIKYNSSGIQQWVVKYNGPGNSADVASSLAVDSSGNVYVTGKSWGSGTGDDYATIKYNSDGVQQWVARYNGPGNGSDVANSLAVDGLGNVFVTGKSYGSVTESDYATIKYNPNGVQQWVTRYNGTANLYDEAFVIAVDDIGNVYVTGRSYESGTSQDYATIKYNPEGVQQWVAKYNGPGNSADVASSLAVDSSGNVYVTGKSWGSGTGDDYATVKYNSDGVQQWVIRYNGTGNSVDIANSLAIDGLGNVYVTGQSFGSGTSHDYVTIKYSQTVDITPISNEIPEQFSLSQNFPNPFNPVTTITFAIPQTGLTKLTIYDALGREIQTLVNEVLTAGTYDYIFDASHLTSGVYFYRLKSDDFIETKRLILLK